MTHEEIMQAAEKNRFVKHCDIQVAKTDDGSYCAYVEIKPQHKNPYDIVHGGLLYTMADAAAGCNARKYGAHPVTLNSDFHYLANTASGKLTASVNMIRAGRTVLVLQVIVTAEDGKRLAEGVFTYLN